MPTETISLLRIHPDPNNVRDTISDADIADLAKSIKRVGLLQDPVVYQVAEDEVPGVPGGDYVTSAGHRRLRAINMLPIEIHGGVVQCKVIAAPAGELERLDLMGTENLNRRSLNPIEEAKLYNRYYTAGLTQVMIAERLSVNQGRVSHCMSLLALPVDTQHLIAAGEMSFPRALQEVRKHRREAGTLRGDAGKNHAAGATNSSGMTVPHFDYDHPLQRRAAQRCTNAGGGAVHLDRFNGACGKCWEHVIRADEAGRTNPTAGVPRPGGRPAPAPTTRTCTFCGAQGMALEGGCSKVVGGKRVIRSSHVIPFVGKPR